MGALRYNEITWAIAYFLGPMLQAMCIMCVCDEVGFFMKMNLKTATSCKYVVGLEIS